MAVAPESEEDVEPTIDVDAAEEAWSCNAKDVRVEVWDNPSGRFVEIPTVEVETQVTSDISARDTLTTVHAPVEWKGHRVTPLIDAWNSRQSAGDLFDVVIVSWRDQNTGEFKPRQTGWIRGVGGSPQNGVFKFVVQGWEAYMKKISASVSFGSFVGGDVTYSDVLSYVTDKLNEANVGRGIVDFGFTTIGPNTDFAGAVYDDIFGNEDFVGRVLSAAPNTYSAIKNDSVTNKDFSASEHTLLDVMEFYTGELDHRWYFSPTGNIYVITQPYTDLELYVDSAINDDLPDEITVDTIQNDALREIAPINAAWVEGDTLSGVGEPGKIESIVWGASTFLTEQRPPTLEEVEYWQTNKYPIAVAWYPPLMQDDPDTDQLLARDSANRFGGIGNVLSTSHSYPDAAEQAAKRKLRKDIETIGEGDMLLKGKPDIAPLDKVKAYPTICKQADETEEFVYEVTGVTHRQMEGGKYKTTVDVTMDVQESLIESASTIYEG